MIFKVDDLIVMRYFPSGVLSVQTPISYGVKNVILSITR